MTSPAKTSGAILAIDQGTTSSRAIVFGGDQSIISVAQQEFTQHFPKSGWVEHDPEEIWETVVAVCREALSKVGVGAHSVAAIGITNQRETTLIWDRKTGKPIRSTGYWTMLKVFVRAQKTANLSSVQSTHS